MCDDTGTLSRAQLDYLARLNILGPSSHNTVPQRLSLEHGAMGLWLDRRLGTTPIFIITLTIAGFIGASASLYYRYKHQISVIEAETAALRAAAEER